MGFIKTHMKTLRTTALVLAAAAVTSGAAAMKTRIRSGSFAALSTTKELNVRYDYSNMTVTTKDLDEASFIEDKKADLERKEAGRGAKWAASWVSDRTARFAPQYKEEFEKQSGITLVENTVAKYTMVVHTTHTETGYNIGISRRNAYIDGEITIVETANPSNVICTISVDNAPGRDVFGYDFDTGERLSEAYAKMGKEVGKLIRKKME